MNLPDQASIKKYTEVSVRLADPSLLLELKKFFERKYDLAELLDWLHGRIAWGGGGWVVGWVGWLG
ncbi:hypothetical protein MUP01_00020 [Candidatus Bathyarchaeota archaeon]|nr:hypothetical protein [Candidatus Bathyarchaeota archaeon]